MYPEINKFLELLHGRGLSSFLVTNAQFPDQIRGLEPCTQLYVSIDASSKESLRKIDRPLFRDFWERFLDSLDAMRDRKQRTVYRLTLVKDFNVEELDGYVELVQRGEPDFIEVKGVTYCGYSGANPLTMSNVPFHREVAAFVESMAGKLSDNYAIACEHAHSCSLLIAHKKYCINGEWHTWIDYEKFQLLYNEYKESGRLFTSLDYAQVSPTWALYGSADGGFDPMETRHYRNKKKGEV